MMKLSLPLVLAVLTILSTCKADTSAEEVGLAWRNFKLNYRKDYRSIHQEVVRKANFIENYNRIAEHNRRFEHGLVTYSLKINKYSDLSDDEFKESLTGYKKSEISLEDNIEIIEFVPDPKLVLPDEFDWREKGAVTPVKDQGVCAACWAFSATGALEGQYFLKTGKLVSMSEQNLVDCSKEDDNSGCRGGDMSPAFTYVHNNDGIDTEESYPYEDGESECRYNVKSNLTSVKGYATIENGNEEYLKAAIATIGPISVAIDGGQMSFRSYHKGVYYDENCIMGLNDPAYELDHAVLAIGYGSENGQDYWLIKNSWGTTWGDEGYMKVSRNTDNNCGVAAEASFPINY